MLPTRILQGTQTNFQCNCWIYLYTKHDLLCLSILVNLYGTPNSLADNYPPTNNKNSHNNTQHQHKTMSARTRTYISHTIPRREQHFTYKLRHSWHAFSKNDRGLLSQGCSIFFDEFLREKTEHDGSVLKVCIVCGQLPALHWRKPTQPTSSSVPQVSSIHQKSCQWR